MRRLVLTSATTLFAFLLLAPPAWAEWVWPLHGEVITPYRNGGDPYASGQHRGIDIAGHPGAPVVAAAGGEVRFAGIAGSSGLTVSIRTADGRFDTSYLHLSSAAVRKGDLIGAGERVGAVGSSGIRSAERPHLHLGIRDAGSRHAYHDPLGFLPAAPVAPQPPREAPAPQPAPVSPAPAPAPVRVPSDRRVPVGEPAPRPVPIREPAARRVPVRTPAPVRAPAPVPVRGPTAVPVRAPGGHPAAARPAPGPQQGHEGPGRPSVAAAANREVRRGNPARATAPAAPGSTPSGDGTGSGPDLGLLLACLGLLAAAATLGLSGDRRKATRRTGTGRRVARLLEPLRGKPAQRG